MRLRWSAARAEPSRCRPGTRVRSAPGRSSVTHAHPIGEPAHERLAGASCASDTHSSGWWAWAMWPGPQITVGIAGVVEPRRLGAERHLAVAGRPLQARPSAAMSLSPAVSKPGIVDSRSNSMKLSGSTALHLGQGVLRVRLDFAKELVRIVERQMADLELERAVARHDVERGAAADGARVHGGVGDVVGVVEAARGRGTGAPSLARRETISQAISTALTPWGVSAEWRLAAADAATPAFLPLCATTISMPVGSPTMQPSGRTPRAAMSAISRRTPMQPTSSS